MFAVCFLLFFHLNMFNNPMLQAPECRAHSSCPITSCQMCGSDKDSPCLPTINNTTVIRPEYHDFVFLHLLLQLVALELAGSGAREGLSSDDYVLYLLGVRKRLVELRNGLQEGVPEVFGNLRIVGA